MSSIDVNERIKVLENIAGFAFPPDYIDWLRRPERRSNDKRQTPFDLDELAETQRLVQDVLPPGTTAIARDEGGDLFLLRGADGAIEWWSHEREIGEHHTVAVAPSFAAYLDLLESGELEA